VTPIRGQRRSMGHDEQRGETGAQVCWPKLTSSRFQSSQ
jgi:hypothetical protein